MPLEKTIFGPLPLILVWLTFVFVFTAIWRFGNIDVSNSEIIQTMLAQLNYTPAAQVSTNASLLPVLPSVVPQTSASPRKVSSKKSGAYPSIKSRTCRFILDDEEPANGLNIEFSRRYFQTLKIGVRLPSTFHLSGLSKVVKSEGKPVKVYWKRDGHTNPPFYESMKGCETKCIVTSSAKDADFLLSTKRPMKKVNSRQKTVWFSREALYHVGEHVQEFDLTMDFGPFSNIPVLCIPPNFYKTMLNMPVPSLENVKKRKLAVWVARNCGPAGSSPWRPSWGRAEYVRTMMKYMDIDCPGRCNNNIAAAAAGFGGRNSYTGNMKGYSNYMFVFSLHNTLDNINVDEKFYHPYQANSVPVVVGPDTVYSFQPGDHSFVDATVYNTPRDLAEKLMWYKEHPKEYLETFFSYRKKLPNASMERLHQEFEQAGAGQVKGVGDGCRICACKANPDCMRKRNVSKCGYTLP